MKFNIRKKNVLVTGGTGQIGSFLIDFLVKKQSNVKVIGRHKSHLKEIKTLVDTDKVYFIKCDLTNKKNIESIKSEIKNVDYLIHLGSEFSQVYPTALEEAEQSINLNLKGTIELLSHLDNLTGILFSSSIAVYGTPDYIPVDEQCPTNPTSFYGCGKLGAEKYMKLYSNIKSVPLTILRYSGVYGPRNRSNQAIPVFIQRALRDEPISLFEHGKELRDYIYITDVIDATIKAITVNKNDIFNIGSGIKNTIAEVVDMIIELTNSKSKIIFSKKSMIHNFVCNISKAEKKLGFIPQVYLNEGLQKEIDWHKSINQ